MFKMASSFMMQKKCCMHPVQSVWERAVHRVRAIAIGLCFKVMVFLYRSESFRNCHMIGCHS